MNRAAAFLLLSLLASPAYGDDLEDRVKSVPNPRPSGSWISDPAGIVGLRKGDIDSAISDLERQTSAEIAVVVVPTIGQQVPRDFAVALFEHWGIGKKGKDNGILVLHVLDQRRVEIETGYGMEGILPDVKCKWIIDEVMRPYFQRNQFADGHLEIVRALVRGVKNPEISREDLIRTETEFVEGLEAPPAIPADRVEVPAEDLPAPVRKYGVAGGFVGGIGLYILGWLVTTVAGLGKDPYRKYKIYSAAGFPFQYGAAFLPAVSAFTLEYTRNATFWATIPALVLLWILVHFARSRKLDRLRNEPRACPKCGKLMTRLEEDSDDRYLQAGQVAEEKIDSIDYDVWVCECGGTRIEPYDGSASAEVCEKCNYRTYQLISSVTVRAATTSSEGLRELHYRCAYCSYERTVHETIPKISTSSSSSSGGSSGGSFGGGRSGGGGAGGSY